jgi:diguanylate cyclase (GGDEF)-like protein/PAS domain S-box-containing protein
MGAWAWLGQWRLRAYLTTLVAVSLLVVLGIAAFALKQATNVYRDATADRLRDMARTLSLAVERDLTHTVTLVRTLTALHVDASTSQEWLRSAVPELGQVRVVHMAIGSPTSAAAPIAPDLLPAGLVEAAVASREPVLSDLYHPPPDAEPMVAIAAHDGADGQVQALILSPRQLVRIAPQASTAEASLLIAVTDGQGRIVARSRDNDRFLGRPVPDWGKLQAMKAERGLFEARTSEGLPIIFAFHKLAGTPGWVVVVGEPMKAFNARWQQPVRSLLIGGAIALMLSLALTSWLVRQLLRPVRSLARDARDILAAADAGPQLAQAATPTPALRIREFESMRESIEAAHAALRQRAQALQSSELRYRKLAQAGALVLWRSDPEGALLAATGWHVLTGEPDEQALGKQWIDRVHPDEANVVRELQARVAAGAREIDAEFRIAALGGGWRWVRTRGAIVEDAALGVSEWVGVFEDIEDRRQAEARVAFMAHHDALTGLPNRIKFRNELDASIRRASRGELGAVLLLDLDGFKAVNDTLGHPAGDALLSAVAERLLGLVRDTDMVARLGGDEFAVLQTQLVAATDAEGLAARIIEALKREFVLDGQPARVGVSIGICLIAGSGLDAERCLKGADLALYRSKNEGRGRHNFFDAVLGNDDR